MCLHGVTICVTHLVVLLVQFNFHAKWPLMLLIFCVMIMLDVLNFHEFFQNYLNHFCFDWEFSFIMIKCVPWIGHWLLLPITWTCLLILVWSFLGLVLDWLNMIRVEFELLFWIFDPPLTLGFDLVVWTYMWALNFRTKHQIPWLMLLHHLNVDVCYLIANIWLFCRLMLTHLSLPYGLHILYIGIVCCLLTVVCLSEYCTDLFSCFHRYLSCFKFIWTLLLLGCLTT
jgi:hypothetical protein